MASQERSSRNLIKCPQCRAAHKPCHDSPGQHLCDLCIARGWPCGPRTRIGMNTSVPAQEIPSEYVATINVTINLVNLVLQQCAELSRRVERLRYGVDGWNVCFTEGLKDQQDMITNIATILSTLLLNHQAGKMDADLVRSLPFYPAATRHGNDAGRTISRNIIGCVLNIPANSVTDQSAFSNLPCEEAEIERFEDCERYIKGLLESISGRVQNSTHDRSAVFWGFPAAFIAFWNGNHNTAITLWLKQNDPLQKDILGRNFLQIVAESNGLGVLYRILQLQADIGGLNHSHLDHRRLSAFSIASCKGYSEFYEALATLNLDILPESEYWYCGCPPTLQEFALISGNDKIVALTIDRGLSSPPYTRGAEIAIRRGRGDLAAMFLDEQLRTVQFIEHQEVQYLELQAVIMCYDLVRMELSAVSRCTEKRWPPNLLTRMQTLLEKLKTIPKEPPGPNDAVHSLTCM